MIQNYQIFILKNKIIRNRAAGYTLGSLCLSLKTTADSKWLISPDANTGQKKTSKDMLEDYPDLFTRKQTPKFLHIGKNWI